MQKIYNLVCSASLLITVSHFGEAKTFAQDNHWVGTWGCGVQLTEPRNLPPPPGLTSNTLRQIVRVTIGGKELRVRFSNLFGTGAVEMKSVHIALNPSVMTSSAIDPATDRALTFGGAGSVVIPAGKEIWSDPVAFDLPPLTNLAITIYFGATSKDVTGHPGSRIASYILTGDAATATNMDGAVKTEHWYNIEDVDVRAGDSSQAIVTLGDSITDGRGSTTDANNRWPDDLAVRLHTNSPTAQVSVVNMGIGGNGIFAGLGPSAKSRFDRDVLNQSSVRWLIIFEGVNDIGGAFGERAETLATNIIATYKGFIAKAHAHDVRVYGATITPFGGSFYDRGNHVAIQETVNAWIRTNHLCDAVIDFDAAVRDPAAPTKLLPAYDSGDHLHLNPTGYHAMADAIDLNLFTK
jgi:lysophospholipase L1-like esterase